MKYKLRTSRHTASCSCPKFTGDINEIPVHGNLSVTPAQMMRMAEKGIPISSQNLSMTSQDGEPQPSFDLPLDRLRGVDPAEMWEQGQIIRERAKIAHNRDRKRFGDGELKFRDKK